MVTVVGGAAAVEECRPFYFFYGLFFFQFFRIFFWIFFWWTWNDSQWCSHDDRNGFCLHSWLLEALSSVPFSAGTDASINLHHLSAPCLGMISGLLAGTVLSAWICWSYRTVPGPTTISGLGLWSYHLWLHIPPMKIFTDFILLFRYSLWYSCI